MISFTEFVNKVESAKPPILKEYKKKVRLSNLQGVGLCLLIFFSIFLPILIYDCSQDKECTFSSGNSFGAIMALSTIYIGGWIGFIYSLKYPVKQKRKEFTFRPSTYLLDTIVVILGIIILSAIFSANMPQDNGKLSPIQYVLIFLEFGAVSWYFKNPKRKKMVVKSYQRIPLYQILGTLDIRQNEEAPFYLSLSTTIGVIRFNHQDLTEKFGYYERGVVYGSKAAIGDVYEGIVVDIPYTGQPTDSDIKKYESAFTTFINSFIGKDLFFHRPIKERRYESQNGHLYLYLITYHGNGAKLPNLYLDKYFYYTREDLDTIYKDVQTLMNAIDDRYA